MDFRRNFLISCPGWTLRFKLGASLMAAQVRLFVNLQSREKYTELAWTNVSSDNSSQSASPQFHSFRLHRRAGLLPRRPSALLLRDGQADTVRLRLRAGDADADRRARLDPAAPRLPPVADVPHQAARPPLPLARASGRGALLRLQHGPSYAHPGAGTQQQLLLHRRPAGVE